MLSNLTRKCQYTPWRGNERYYIFLLFFSSFLTAIFEIVIIKEFTVATNNVHTSAYLFFAFLQIFFGVGSYFAHKFFVSFQQRKTMRLALMATGVLVVYSLLTVLVIDVTRMLTLILNIAFVSLAFIGIGIVYGFLVIYFCRERGRDAGVVIAVSLMGLMLGFVVEPYLAMSLGVNATFLLNGIFWVLLCIDSPFYLFFSFFVVLSVAALFSPDNSIEKFRNKKMDMNYRLQERFFRNQFKEVFSGWSPYTKLNIFSNGKMLVGAYNYRLFWAYNKDRVKKHIVPIRFVRDHDKVLLIGASAGKEFHYFRPTRKSTKDNTLMVEIDPLVVKYFKDYHPEYNDNIYNTVTVVAADGRNVLDEMKEKQDAIIIGTLESTARNIWMLNEFKNNLYTIEGLSRCFQLLGERGVLLVYREEGNPVLVNAICASLKKLDVHFRVFKIPFFAFYPNRIRYYIYASHSPDRIAEITRQLGRSGIKNEIMDVEDAPYLSDDRNYINLVTPSGKMVLNTFLGILAGVLFLAFLTISLGVKKKSRSAMLYFLLIGAGFFLTQMFLIAKFKSFFGHPLKTLVMVTLMFFLSVAVGNLCAHRIRLQQLRNKFLLHILIVLMILGCFQISVSHIPFAVSSYWGKLFVAMMTIFPMGLLCGFYYPLGLSLNKDGELGLAIFFDSLGTCVAFLLFYSTYWLHGISANFYSIAICYFFATILISLCRCRA